LAESWEKGRNPPDALFKKGGLTYGSGDNYLDTRRYRLPIYASGTPINLHPFVSSPNFLFGNRKRLCFTQKIPPTFG